MSTVTARRAEILVERVERWWLFCLWFWSLASSSLLWREGVEGVEGCERGCGGGWGRRGGRGVMGGGTDLSRS